MTSNDGTMDLDGMMDGTPPPVHHTQPIDLPDEWDEPTAEWVATLRDDSGDTIALRPVWDPPDPATGGDGPHTTSELVLMPGYTQSAWDRRQVRQLQAAEDGEYPVRVGPAAGPPAAGRDDRRACTCGTTCTRPMRCWCVTCC